MEFSGPAPLGSQMAIAAQIPLHRAPEVKKIDESRRPDGSGADARQRPEQDQTAAAVRDLSARRREAARHDLPTGPPPSFEVSLLEMDADLQQVIARIEAARAKDRDAEAIGITIPPTPTAVGAGAEATGPIAEADHVEGEPGGSGASDVPSGSVDTAAIPA